MSGDMHAQGWSWKRGAKPVAAAAHSLLSASAAGALPKRLIDIIQLRTPPRPKDPNVQTGTSLLLPYRRQICPCQGEVSRVKGL